MPASKPHGWRLISHLLKEPNDCNGNARAQEAQVDRSEATLRTQIGEVPVPSSPAS